MTSGQTGRQCPAPIDNWSVRARAVSKPIPSSLSLSSLSHHPHQEIWPGPVSHRNAPQIAMCCLCQSQPGYLSQPIKSGGCFLLLMILTAWEVKISTLSLQVSRGLLYSKWTPEWTPVDSRVDSGVLSPYSLTSLTNTASVSWQTGQHCTDWTGLYDQYHLSC